MKKPGANQFGVFPLRIAAVRNAKAKVLAAERTMQAEPTKTLECGKACRGSTGMDGWGVLGKLKRILSQASTMPKMDRGWSTKWVPIRDKD